MSSQKPDSVFRSSIFRITSIASLIFVIALLVIGLTAGFISAHLAKTSELDRLQIEHQRLSTLYEEKGLDALTSHVREIGNEFDDDELFYYLGIPDSIPLAGMEWLESAPDGLNIIRIPGEDDDEPAYGVSGSLDADHRLAVGSTLETHYDILELIPSGLVWLFVISLPLSLILGYSTSRLVFGRIATLSQTTGKVSRGNLDERVPLRGTNDEFDTLSKNINNMLAAIQQLTRNIRDVSVGIAHDLRTPITRLGNRLQRLKAAVSEEDAAFEHVLAIEEQVGIITSVFDALLRLGEIQSGKRRRAFKPLNLSELVTSIAQSLQPVIEELQKDLSTDIQPDLSLAGDEILLTQLVTNLCENAIEHTPPETKIWLSLKRDGTGILLSIADDGPGISEEDLHRIFERFVRLDESRSTKGSGLGLALVQAISQLHDGTASATNRTGGGALFKVWIPLTSDETIVQ